jgi:hypothetical protein
MSSLTPVLGDITPRTIVQQLRAMTIACSFPGCQWKMSADHARVPDLLHLYLGIRGGPVDMKHPQSAAELASEARCWKHPLAEGVRMFPLLTTAAVMDRWASNNAREMGKRQEEWRPKAQTTRPSYISSLLAQRKPEDDNKPRPKYRHRTRPLMKAERPPNAQKRFGDEIKPGAVAPDNKKKKKSKKKDNQEKGKNKQPAAKIKGRR